MVCGYGERYVVHVPKIPKFKNGGYNNWFVTNGIEKIKVSGFDPNHESNDSKDKIFGFNGWVELTNGKNSTTVFLHHLGNEEYKVSG